jgi:hypothetical protein
MSIRRRVAAWLIRLASLLDPDRPVVRWDGNGLVIFSRGVEGLPDIPLARIVPTRPAWGGP